MALYTLKTEEEAFAPLMNYNGNNQWVNNQRMALFGPSASQTEMYNTLGRDAGSTSGDNFFTKRAKSIENAIGTTLAAPISLANDAIQRGKTERLLNEGNASMADIYKKYGYDNADAYYDASNKEMDDLYKKYGYTNGENYWEDRYLAKSRGDNAAVEALDKERADIISRMNAQDAERANYYDNIQRELTGQAQTNADKMNENARQFEDYAKNDYISQKINQDRGKFLGSAINTLSTGADVLLPGAGVAFNAAQGGIEGVADELEQNGLENFDWGRAGQNAGIGAVTGGVVGGVNKGISNKLAKNGGNLFKGNNALTSGLNNLGSKTALGRMGSTIATGVGRGAISGAVGGATGAGLSSAMNGVDLSQGISNTLQGAVQGAQQGAVAGGVMAGANMALNATPGVGNVMRNLNQAGEDWKNSGSNFNERLTNTLTSGKSPVGEWLQGNRQSRLLGAAGQLGNRVDLVDGEVYYPRVDVEVSGGRPVAYNIADIKKYPGATPQGVPSGGDQPAVDYQGTYGRETIVPQNEQNVNPETEVYRTLTGETEQPFLAYGESELGNRTRRGMVADSLERFGNTLEGAQTNVTRAAAKDLGIESTGKVIENVRKKTGITNLETQAKLARELTGGENSLMDNIQRQALTASEDGIGYRVNTDPVLKEIDSIVDKYADTNMFGSQNARNKFISNLKQDITNFDSDVLTIANRMKANAADLRGRGVTSPTPADSAKAKIYSEVANRLDDLSYKAIPQDNVDAMFDAAISEMRGRANQAAQNGNRDVAKAYNKLADSLNAEPRTIKAYRSFKKDFVDAAKISDLTNLAENGAAVQMGRGFGGGIKKFVGTVAQRPVNAALAKLGGGVNSLADRVAGETTPSTTPTPTTVNTTANNYNPATQVYNAIGRTEGAINAQNARANEYISEAAQNANTLESLVTPTVNTATGVYNSVYGKPTSTSSDTYGGYWAKVLEIAMESAMTDGDVQAFSELYSMYQDALSKNKTKDYSDVTNWSAKDRSDYLKAQNGLSQIKQLEESYNKAVGDGGGNSIQGTFRQLANNISGGNLDPTASNYVKQAESMGAGIIKNLVNLGSTEYDAKRYVDYLPKLTDTKEQAQQKLETLYNAYNDILNNLYSAYGL